ncbi:alpha-1,2-fucosyltransferase [Spirosoma sp. RP8]|uniref:Alpha-1,2-fucosyltransferase n=1 Tax=Spirosoma liriopis TaxID=2937440 RepID=A0ABT0HTX7_9BACT|nr:alpha-1,2-fucosyltransferase [Spirosoma liriopis]MCK8495663.1 alpha-1,2-fucosyltransferase [Spirosoma liriopis]
MVIARISGGLGNQLFQYALGRRLALQNKTSLYFDLSYYKYEYETDTPRKFKLYPFGIDYRLLDTSPYLYVSKATKLFPDRTLKPFVEFHLEEQFHVDPELVKAKSKVIILDGCWQSETYFATAADTIRKELTFKRQTGSTFGRYKAAIEREAIPISLHIRRGDYVTHPEFSQSFGFLGLDYYQRAIPLLTDRFSQGKFFIFSDDPDWVRQNLAINAPHEFVTNTRPEADLDDLQLMGLCHHHIIANSSFSWWGAWLNPRKDKVVIAPKQWFKNKPTWDTKDLIPANWSRI